MTATPARIRDFWFSTPVRRDWFAQSADLDAAIAGEFAATHRAAHDGALDHWMENAADALALVIVLDQFPRNMFRGSARAFASDDRALARATAALDLGHDQAVDETRRQFFYLPFMHAEDMDAQRRSVALYEALGEPRSLHFAREHHDIVARFGRFPHRNAAIGRAGTPEEIAFLNTHKGF